MSDLSTIVPAAREAAKPAADVSLSEFASLVAGMSRLVFRLGTIPSFKGGDLGLAEWVALMALAQREGINNKQLANHLGVTGQRVNQITASLSSAGLISVSQSEEDSRNNVITVTESGKAKLAAVNAQLMPFMSSALKDKTSSVLAANKHVRSILGATMRAMQPTKAGNEGRTETN